MNVTFVSPVYEGSASNKQILEESGLLDLLERGDSLMADKGFQIQELRAFGGVRVNISAFCRGTQQMLPVDVASTKIIPGVRIHVERKMQRIKSFAILSNELPNSMFDIMEQIMFVCAALTIFQAALAA